MFISTSLYCLINRDVIDKIKKNSAKKKKYSIFTCAPTCTERITHANHCFRSTKLKKKTSLKVNLVINKIASLNISQTEYVNKQDLIA